MMKLIAVLICVFASSALFAGENKIFEIEMVDGPGVNICNVVFFQKKPKPSIVDEMLLQSLKMSIKIDDSKEILASAFYKDVLMSSSDYSGRLIYDPSKKKIITWNEHQGIKSTVYDTGKYFVKAEEHETAVTPKRKWLSIMIVFPEKPTQQEAYSAMIETIRKYKHKGMKINSYVSVGNKKNERTWKQVKDRNRGYIAAEYDPSSGKITSKGKIIK